jgi:N-acetylglucosamine-6-phosphate deacetylase
MVFTAGVPVADAVKMMTATPASIMDVADRKGSIAAGKDADIVIFDEGINVEFVMIKGNIVYSLKGI